MTGGAWCVVVWEWEQCGQWLPFGPGVSRVLERAHDKQLTRVVLADAEPALHGTLNLRTLTQTTHNADGSTVESRVRRACYSVCSPGGRWEWAHSPQHWDPLPMEVQCSLEEAWSTNGAPVGYCGWSLCASRMIAWQDSRVRHMRRITQPPYPRVRAASNAPPPPAPVPQAEVRRARIPQQHTGSSVHSMQSVKSTISSKSAHSAKSAQSIKSNGTVRNGARSVSPRERKPGLARQILHNLNIFSNNNKASPPQIEKHMHAHEAGDTHTDTECSSTKSPRRHSVDTVSTYLSHESKESLQAGAVGELLNCSAGSDDVFDPPRPPHRTPHPATPPAPDGTIVGVDSASSSLSVWVRSVSRAQWGAVCPACLRALDAHRGAVVSLTRCHHMLHLRCLNDQLNALQHKQEALYIECLVCGEIYGSDPTPRAPVLCIRPEENLRPEDDTTQPAGSMAWCHQPSALPKYPHTGSILLTYNFQSGRQCATHPSPGAPYYAVGFPRHTLLPDTHLGRQVLSALRAAWERRRLFCISASLTTGREHVVAWRITPPPADRAQYAAMVEPDRVLTAALQRLYTLVSPADCQ